MENSTEITTVGRSNPTFNTLPGIGDLPTADVVVFDGKCNFCRRSVGNLEWFAAGKLAYVSLHDPSVARNYPDLSHDQLMKQIYVVSSDGKRYGGAAALKYLSRKLPRLWFAFPLFHIPFSLPLWQFLYNKVAKYRYLIAGKSDECETGSCQVHFDK